MEGEARRCCVSRAWVVGGRLVGGDSVDSSDVGSGIGGSDCDEVDVGAVFAILQVRRRQWYV